MNSFQNELEEATKLQEFKSSADLLATYMYQLHHRVVRL